MQQEENRKCHRNEAADIEKRRHAAWSTASDMYRRGPVPYSRSGTSSMRDPPNLSPQRHQGPERSEICVHLRRQNLELKSQLRRISLWAPSSLWDDGVPWCWARQAGRSCSEDEVLSLSCLSLRPASFCSGVLLHLLRRPGTRDRRSSPRPCGPRQEWHCLRCPDDECAAGFELVLSASLSPDSWQQQLGPGAFWGMQGLLEHDCPGLRRSWS